MLQVREMLEEEASFPVYKRYLVDKLKERQRRREEKLSRENWPVRRLRFSQQKEDEKGIQGESGQVQFAFCQLSEI